MPRPRTYTTIRHICSSFNNVIYQAAPQVCFLRRTVLDMHFFSSTPFQYLYIFYPAYSQEKLYQNDKMGQIKMSIENISNRRPGKDFIT